MWGGTIPPGGGGVDPAGGRPNCVEAAIRRGGRRLSGWFVRASAPSRYFTAIGLMMACTAPVMRAGPSVNRNSQALSFTISSVFMFSRM